MALIEAHAAELAAVVLEPLVQGAAGMALVPAEAVAAVARAAAAHAVLVIHDEVATGFGRTGTLFATEQCGVQPDLLVLGKGITGGYLPLSATAATGPWGIGSRPRPRPCRMKACFDTGASQ